MFLGFPGGLEVKASAYNVGDLGSIPGLGRSTGGGNGNPPQYSCLENPMDGRAWWTTVHRVTKSRTQLSDFTHTHTHTTCSYKALFFLSFYELVCYGKYCRGVGFSPYTKSLHQLKKPLFKHTNCESCLCNTASYFKMF